LNTGCNKSNVFGMAGAIGWPPRGRCVSFCRQSTYRNSGEFSSDHNKSSIHCRRAGLGWGVDSNSACFSAGVGRRL
jgi:hypothetical protein